MSNNILNFIKRMSLLRDIDRCANTPHIKEYSVAVHSYYTAIFAMMFADMENERILAEIKLDNGGYVLIESEVTDKFYDISEVLKKALIHDMEESETGDILFPLHDENPEFKKALDEIRKKCVDTIVFKELPDKVRNCYIKLWHEAKDFSNEGILIAAMDKFEILIYAIHEIELGNRPMRAIYDNAMKILKENFNIPSLTSVLNQIQREYGL